MLDVLLSNLLTVGVPRSVFAMNLRSLMPIFAHDSMVNGVQSLNLCRANSISPGSLNERAPSLSSSEVAGCWRSGDGTLP